MIKSFIMLIWNAENYNNKHIKITINKIGNRNNVKSGNRGYYTNRFIKAIKDLIIYNENFAI